MLPCQALSSQHWGTNDTWHRPDCYTHETHPSHYVAAERVYCEQEHAVGCILNYGEEDRILGKTLQRTPVPVGEKGNTA